MRELSNSRTYHDSVGIGSGSSQSVDSERTHKFDVYTLREHCTTCNGPGCVEVNRDAEGWYTFRICPECRAFDGTGRAR